MITNDVETVVVGSTDGVVDLVHGVGGSVQQTGAGVYDSGHRAGHAFGVDLQTGNQKINITLLESANHTRVSYRKHDYSRV